jgi:lycopene beta-cyclase
MGDTQVVPMTTQAATVHADVVVIGAGPAGSLMTMRLARHPGLSGLRVVLVDQSPEPLAGRWWAYWGRQPLVPGADSGDWDRVQLRAADRVIDVPLDQSRYRRLDGSALAATLAEVVSGAPGVRRVRARVVGVGQSDHAAVVRLAGGGVITTRWVLDSTTGPRAERAGPWLSFLGWRVWPDSGPMDTRTVGLMDFQVPQRDGLRFGHYLPEIPEHGFLELCSFRCGGPDPDLATDLPAWITEHLGGRGFHAEPIEDDAYPLLTRGSRRLGTRVLAIGHRGGLVRPSTGYGLVAYSRDADSVANSLARHKHPFHLPRPRRRDRTLDLIALEVLRQDPPVLQQAYLDMFARNPAERVLAFLNGTAGGRETAALVGTLPIGPFTVGAVRHLWG